MSAARCFAVWAFLCFSAPALASQSGAVSLSHYEALQRLSIDAPSGDGQRKLAAAGPVNMRFDALGRSYELQLTPNSNLLEAARHLVSGGIVPYRGALAGIPNSWVRIVIADGEPAGLIWDGKELLAIEPAHDNAAGTNATIVYRLADAVVAPGAMTCGAGALSGDAGTFYKSMVRELRAAAARDPGAVSEIDIGAVGDFEFTSQFGPTSVLAESAIVTRMNNVDGIFSQDVGVQINVPVIETFTDSNDPFTDTTVPGDLLDELATYRGGNATQNANGLTHLWTGRDLNGTTVGIAFTGTWDGMNGSLVLCSTNFGAGLSQGGDSPGFDSLIAAHEIGHNFGAPHDGEAGSACESETGDFIMATSLRPETMEQFSQCSITQMSDDVAEAEARGCITPIPSVDMRVSLDGEDPTVLLGNSVTVTFDVVNAGTLQADNVTAGFTLPGNITLVSAAASMGDCTDGGGAVNCTIGDVAGTTTVTVTLTFDTITVGAENIDASVTADNDDNTSNNTGSALVTVEPAVNLVVNGPATQQLNVDQSGTVTATLENTSTMDATGVTLSVSLSAGLRADTATWTIGSCTATVSRVDCQATDFQALSTATLSLGVTATTEGAKTVDVSIASVEADADPGNNSANATINVAAAAGSSGGGGSIGFLLLLLLSVGALLEARIRRSEIVRDFSSDHSRFEKRSNDGYWMKLLP